MQVPSRLRILVCLFALVPLTGCLIGRSRKVAPRLLTTATLQEATLEQLIAIINSGASSVQTLNASVEIDVSTGGAKKGKVTDYREVSGYVLVRKPEMLRMFGLVPVVRNRLFDMVSNGQTFEVSVPTLSKFYVGSNQKTGPPSPQVLENLRPQQIFDALLLRPIDPENERAVMEQGSETVRDPKTHKEAYAPNYIVLVIRKDPSGNGWYLSRKIVFSRVDLMPHEQYLYNREAQLATFTRYEDFANFNGTLFPSRIDIQRPIEEYAITLTVTKLRLNEPLADDTFVLTQPPGSKLINLDQRSANAGAQPDQQEQQSRFEQ
jgi:outer membrane lipoprotein-sorting protein